MQLFWRLNHARQTVDFVKRQRAAFGRLDKARMTVFEVGLHTGFVQHGYSAS